jgi:integral membrane protein
MSNSFFSSALGRFRFIAILEGISFLILLFIAMPLKYAAGKPEFVKYVGWAHGVLFVLYLIFLLQAWIKQRWKFGKVIKAFVASLLPFGTFVMDKQLKTEAPVI